MWVVRRGISGTGKIPLVGREIGSTEKRRKAYLSNARDLYAKGYRLFKNSAFRLTDTDGEKIILPRSMMDEVRKISDDQISIEKAFDRVTNPVHGHFLIHIIRGDLTRNLNRINPRLAEETTLTVVDEIGPCEDWTTMVLYPKLLRIVAIVSGNIFLGPELCRREEYVNSSITYTIDLFTAVGKLKQWKSWLRPIGQYYIPELKSVAEHKRKAREFLAPIIAERRKMMKEGSIMPDDMLQWMLDKSDNYNLTDADMSELQLNLTLAAIHTTTLTTALILYDLVAQPGLVEELRKEIRDVLDANGGVPTMHALFEMKLLDSVMKESQRTNPGSLADMPLAAVRFVRYVEKPVTLSDGTYLPKGAMVESAHASIVNDPELYSQPESFNPRRFMDLRSGTGPDPMQYKNKEQYQFVTVTKDFMAFGYGRHACPGRFFAANEIKLILVRLLLEYDIKMPDGLTERYANLEMGLDSLPDPTKELVFKRVKTNV
ncbi:cytochrome P450 [Xylariales sp. PMI_506]|nr:cytochrome P450 [Xylariales sp. PMI_506]